MAVPEISDGQIPNKISHAKSQISKINIYNLHWKLQSEIDQKNLNLKSLPPIYEILTISPIRWQSVCNKQQHK